MTQDEHIVFTFETEEAKLQFEEKMKKVNEDKEFLKLIEQAETEDEVVKALAEKLGIDETMLKAQLKDMCADVENEMANDDRVELGEEELELVAGGNIFHKSWWKNHWKTFTIAAASVVTMTWVNPALVGTIIAHAAASAPAAGTGAYVIHKLHK